MHRKFQAKQTVLLRRLFFLQQNVKHPNEGQQRLSQTLDCGLGMFVRRYNDCKYPHSYLNVKIRRILLKNIGKIKRVLKGGEHPDPIFPAAALIVCYEIPFPFFRNL